MANETEYANIIKNTDIISAGISPALVNMVVATGLIYAEDLPVGTNKKLARKNGRLTAAVLAEGIAHTRSANDELTQTSVDCVAQKHVVFNFPTDEALRFTGYSAEAAANEMAAALARDLDDEILALLTGFSQSVTSASITTVDDLMDACYQIEEENAERVGAPLVALLDKKQAMHIRKEVVKSAASAYTSPNLITLLTGMKQPNGFVGTLPGLEIFTQNTVTDAGLKVGLVFNPDIAFFSMYETQPDFVAIVKREEGFYLELSSKLYAKVVEWNDVAGCQVRSL